MHSCAQITCAAASSSCRKPARRLCRHPDDAPAPAAVCLTCDEPKPQPGLDVRTLSSCLPMDDFWLAVPGPGDSSPNDCFSCSLLMKVW